MDCEIVKNLYFNLYIRSIGKRNSSRNNYKKELIFLLDNQGIKIKFNNSITEEEKKKNIEKEGVIGVSSPIDTNSSKRSQKRARRTQKRRCAGCKKH